MNRILNEYEYPVYVTFCITSLCNADCKHCSSKMATSNDLSTETIIHTLYDLKNCGVFSVALSGGEPLMHPDIETIAETAVNLGLRVGVGTNGKVINKKMVDMLIRTGVDRVQISLDGSNAQTHDSFRGVPGMFDNAIKAIQLLVSCGVKTNICMTPTRLNFTELEDVIDLAYTMGVNGFNLSQFVPINEQMMALDLTSKEWADVLALWYQKKRQYENQLIFTSHEAQLVLIDESYEAMKGFIGCQAGIGNACILSDGTVLPCVMLYEPLGNIKESSFQSIWKNSKTVKKLKDRNNLKGRCHTCENTMKCGGCRAIAKSKNGDTFGYDSRCWKQ